MRGIVPFAPVANRSCQQRGGSGLFVRAYAAPAVDKPDRQPALCAKRPSNDGSTPDLRPPFAPTGKLKPSYNSARSGLQGSRDPLTGKDVHLGRPLSPVSRKKSRVSRPRSSGKSFHFPRRTFSSPPTGCPSRRFAASATPAFGDRSPFLCRRADFFCRRANFFCRRSTHAARPPRPLTRAYRRPDSPIPLPESAASSRPTLPPQPDTHHKQQYCNQYFHYNSSRHFASQTTTKKQIWRAIPESKLQNNKDPVYS